jgi:hypothetical protein
MNSEEDSRHNQPSRAKAWEESWPYVISLVAPLAYAILGHKNSFSPNLKDALIAVAGLAGILAAFFLTSASILVTLQDSWFKKRAVESGVYLALVGYLLTAMGWSLATAVITIAGILFDATWHLWWYRYALIGWVYLISTTLCVSIRVLRIFGALMKYMARY